MYLGGFVDPSVFFDVVGFVIYFLFLLIVASLVLCIMYIFLFLFAACASWSIIFFLFWVSAARGGEESRTTVSVTSAPSNLIRGGLEFSLTAFSRGRDGDCSPPPAQIRTDGTLAHTAPTSGVASSAPRSGCKDFGRGK